MATWYDTGTVSVTNNSATVTGSGTAWVANVLVGEAFIGPDGRTYEITDVVSNTSMTIAPNYLGTNQSGQAYTIVPVRGIDRQNQSLLTDLITNYQSVVLGIGAGLFPDGSAATPAFRFTNDQDTGLYRIASNTIGISADEIRNTGGGFLVSKVRTGANSELRVIAGTQWTSGVTEGVAGIWVREEGTGNFGQASGLLLKTSADSGVPTTRMHISSSGLVSIGQLATANRRFQVQSSGIDDVTATLRHTFQAGSSYRPARLAMGVDKDQVVLSGGGYAANNDIGFFSIQVANGSNVLTERFFIDDSGNIRPGSDNAQAFGGASFRWSVIYSATGTINTSDEREKHWRGELNAAELRAAKRIIAELGIYQWNDAVAEKGEDGARLHFGVRAQQAFAIMEDEGLDWGRYAWCCYDEWPANADPDKGPIVASGDRYGVRPDQLAFWLIAAQAAMQADLEARLAALEAAA